MTRHSENLPALPGGVGILSDRLAVLSGRIAESGDILADYRAAMAEARRNGISIPKAVRQEVRAALRPIERMHTLARLQLHILMLEIECGKRSS